MLLSKGITNYEKEPENYLYHIGDVVNIKSEDEKTIIPVTITGEPKWRNWTEDGSFDYIYPVIYNNLSKRSICESNILSLHVNKNLIKNNALFK